MANPENGKAKVGPEFKKRAIIAGSILGVLTLAWLARNIFNRDTAAFIPDDGRPTPSVENTPIPTNSSASAAAVPERISGIYYDSNGDGFLSYNEGDVPPSGTPFTLQQLSASLVLTCADVRWPGDTAIRISNEVLGQSLSEALNSQHYLIHPESNLVVIPNGIKSRQYGNLNEDDPDKVCIVIKK